MYSLGVLLLELVTKEKPVRGEVPAAQGLCPPALLWLLQRCLEVSPVSRPSAPELLRELQRLGPRHAVRPAALLTLPHPSLQPRTHAQRTSFLSLRDPFGFSQSFPVQHMPASIRFER